MTACKKCKREVKWTSDLEGGLCKQCIAALEVKIGPTPEQQIEIEKNRANAENCRRIAELAINNRPKDPSETHEWLIRLLGPLIGHSVVWAIALVLITYILAVLRK